MDCNDMRHMTQIALLTISCMAMALYAQQPTNVGRHKMMSYDLYSWQEPDGVWNFCVLPDTSREKTVEEVFSKSVG